VQVDPIKPKLKLPATKGLQLNWDEPISKIAFKFKLRRYNSVFLTFGAALMVRRCRLTLSKPALKAPTVRALEAEKCCTAFKLLLPIATCAATPWGCRSRSSQGGACQMLPATSSPKPNP